MNTWKTILQIAISILTAIATTLGVTSCMGQKQNRPLTSVRGERSFLFLPKIRS